MIHRNAINGLIILIAGISLLILSLPRFRSSINQIPINNFFASINDEQRIAKIEKIPKYIAITKASILHHETPGYWQDLANLNLHQAQIQGGIGSQNKTLVQNAEDAARQSLLLSPGNAFLSYQLAVISAFEKKPSTEIANLLLMSIMSSPYELGFMRQRLDFCLMYFSAFNSQDYSYLTDQITMFWTYSKKEFIDLLQYRSDYLDTIKKLLEDKHPDLLKELLTEIKDA